eukprot:CAMPEP_0195527956 /NCGR_PEP_ID=MMETSP0794_2-20130614/29901_1 /TAXON_ID=515487 /ORGANISM="Stephanopyxis turris, Strain CCMP 815" /LENGTH=202 /DNA_ID=CAMNT_0040658983 /DNA_START=33 /DNA_END=638 /DNA_ORIENTATION=-
MLLRFITCLLLPLLASAAFTLNHPVALLSNFRQHETIAVPLATTTQLFAKSGKKKKKEKDGTISKNRLAYRNYEIIETLEAGISLLGTEVKSLRDGQLTLRDGYVKPDKFGHATLHNVHIAKHSHSGSYFQHEETRERKLLLHKSEARKLAQKVETQGMTVVPLKAYFNDDGKVKFQIALVRGKNVRDKRNTIKDREGKREA